MRRALQFLVPVAILLVAGLALWLLNMSKPEAKPAASTFQPPLVQAVEARADDRPFVVRSQGYVEPRSEIDLVSQVSGQILTVSDSLLDGGFFSAGATLLTIDDSEYTAAVAQRKAELAQANLELAQEKAEAATAVERWEKLNPNTPAPDLVARTLQLQQAQARVAAADAARVRAELDVTRTKILAPFHGRVRERFADQKQIVTAGQALARIYAVDFVEVRLPVAERELGFLDMPYVLRANGELPTGPEVDLTTEFAGRSWTWKGRIHRTAGTVDTGTRRVTLVARIAAPFEQSDDTKPPLQVGMFVQAAITGRATASLLAVPRSAVRNGTQLVVVDDDWRIRIREVSIARSEDAVAWIESGLDPGDLICTSTLQAVVDGMQVLVDGRPVPDHVQAAIDARRKKLESANPER